MSELEEFRQQKPNDALAKKLQVVAWILTVVVLGLVAVMREIPKPTLPEGVSFKALPALHAFLNGGAAICLVLAVLAIKQAKVRLHRTFVFIAFALSTLFLLSYVTYHVTTPETIFGDVNKDGVLSETEKAEVGGKRTVYLFVLISHIALAAISFPFILFTFVRGLTNQIAKHRSMAKWVFPLWLYVAITGPVCYFLIKPYY